MRMKKGGDSYELRKSITLFLKQLIIVLLFFDSVYIKVIELLVIFKEFFLKSNILYIANMKFG